MTDLDAKSYLNIRIICAQNLIVGDILTQLSDPYVEISFDTFDKKAKTSTKQKTLNPEWNEDFWFYVDAHNEPLVKFEVFDEDVAKSDFLGRCQVDLKKLNNEERKEMNLELKDVKTGNLRVMICVERP